MRNTIAADDDDDDDGDELNFRDADAINGNNNEKYHEVEDYMRID